MTWLWETVSAFSRTYLRITPTTLAHILWSLVVVVVYVVLRSALLRLARRRIEDNTKKYLVSKTVTYILLLVALLAMLRIWLGEVGGIATYLGILSAGIAIALKDPVANLAGWLYIMMKKPFVVGDRIEIGDHAGDVIDVSLFQFSLVEIGKWVQADQSTGRVIHIPNGWVFKHSTSNYTQGFNFIWNEIPVTVTFESHWEKAKAILLEVAKEHSAVQSEQVAAQIRRAAHRFLIYYQHLAPIVWTSVAEVGVTLTLRYLCEPRQRRSSAEKIWEAILREFAKADDIDFAYPTQRFFNNVAEGKKPAARSPVADQPADPPPE